jgi:hypothetical protein
MVIAMAILLLLKDHDGYLKDTVLKSQWFDDHGIIKDTVIKLLFAKGA